MESGIDRAKQAIDSFLLSAVEETMENMLFEEVESDSDAELKGKKSFWARLPVLKPVCGTVTMIIPNEFARTITRDIYACKDQNVNKTIILDTVSELIHILAGCLIKRLVNESEDFELGLPESGTWSFRLQIDNSISRVFAIGEKNLRVIVSDEIVRYAE